MEFNSLSFIIFFPLITLIYYVLPQKIRLLWLFLSSCLFYMCWNVKYIGLLLSVMFSTYIAAIRIDKTSKPAVKKGILSICICFNIFLLFLFKYFDMFSNTLVSLAQMVNIHFTPVTLDLVLPVGISFYMFQTLGYVIDVYRGDIKSEKNLITYGAFVTFFPQLVAGPIERSKNLLAQIKEKHALNAECCIAGFIRMLWGYFQKVVIADRIAVIVSAVYGNYTSYSGIYIIIATILFAFQIYCDFDGYTNIAMGAANILGFHLMENFNAPYLSRSVAEFWHRWHISLSTWFRDYLYIPLGGNRNGTLKKYRNLFLTFLISGLWHGANWTYVVWGMLHGCYQIIENIFRGAFKKKDKEKPPSNGILNWMITFILVDFAWLFFRADSIKDAFNMLRRIFTNLGPKDILNREMAITIGMEIENIIILILGLLILMLCDLLKNKIDISLKIRQLPTIVRWAVLYTVMLIILIWGYYGPEYETSQFIYFQF